MAQVAEGQIQKRVRCAYDTARMLSQCLTTFVMELHEDRLDAAFRPVVDRPDGLLWGAANVVPAAAWLCDVTDAELLELAAQVYGPSDPPVAMHGYGVFASLLSAYEDIALETIYHAFHESSGDVMPAWSELRDQCPPPHSERYGQWLEEVRLVALAACSTRARARLRFARMNLEPDVWARRETAWVRLDREQAAVLSSLDTDPPNNQSRASFLKPAGYTIADLKEAAGTELDAALSKDRWQKIRKASGLPAHGTGGTEGNRRFSNRDIRTLADTADRLAHATSKRLRDGEKIARAWRALLPSE